MLTDPCPLQLAQSTTPRATFFFFFLSNADFSNIASKQALVQIFGSSGRNVEEEKNNRPSQSQTFHWKSLALGTLHVCLCVLWRMRILGCPSSTPWAPGFIIQAQMGYPSPQVCRRILCYHYALPLSHTGRF